MANLNFAILLGLFFAASSQAALHWNANTFMDIGSGYKQWTRPIRKNLNFESPAIVEIDEPEDEMPLIGKQNLKFCVLLTLSKLS